MKHLKTLIFAILFSTLFYNQNIGLNLSLFTILTILAIGITNKEAYTDKSVIIKAIAYIITGVTIFLFKTDLTIYANILAFFTFIGSVSEKKSSIYINWINGMYTTVVSVFSKHFDNLNSEVKKVKKEKINYSYWIKIIAIPSIILIIFINLYRSGNPMFNDIILQLDFSFINLNWLLFTGLGFYLFNNITNPIQIEPITTTDINTGNYLVKNALKEISDIKIKEEKQLGNVLMLLLNGLIVLFLITYVMHLSEIHNMVASQLSTQVHNGVNALILSNLLAIAIILFLFRGHLNFYDKIKDLKNLTFIWILLNLCIVIVTIVINIEYIISFGLTYKRIGVLFFLTITSTGLITTLIKVSKIKNLWFLFRKNTQIAFALLVLASTINWDKIITYYNINNADQMDLKYLIELSNNNTFLLKDYSEKNEIKAEDERKINIKHNEYLGYLQNNSWQEMVLDNIKIR